ncbi:MAG: hypothetical protein IJZ82_01645 [Lachnospiraceae bacterium]|nr:hypothetical protein [Lachnospiraceae bacterium]
MKLFQKRKKLNNDGMALVLVIVVIAVVAIFASVLMSLALLNFKMMMTEREAKKNFYSAEEVLDQIHIGLEEIVSDAINEAYTKAMQTYKVDEFTEQYRVAQFKLDYMTYVEGKLRDVAAVDQYKVDSLVNMLAVDLQAKYDPDNGPLIIRCGLGEGVANLEATTQGLILKDVSIEYAEGDYYSHIETDIRIGYPEVELNEATVIPNVFDYSIIAHEKLTFDQSVDVSVKGNIYAGEGGAELLNGSEINVENVNYFVTRGELVVNEATRLSLEGDGFWSRGVVVNKSGKLSVDGDVYVQDDLTISGKGAHVVLAGNYYGYGDGSEVLAGISAGNSAIILNCKDATLDMNGLDTLMLCGNAYINGNSIKVDDADVSESATHNSEQIMLGTSVAMKTDQIAFLAPAECLGTVLENGQTKVMVGSNPMSEAEYEKWYNTYSTLVGYKKLDENVAVSALKSPLSAYGLTSASFQTIFKRVGAETICYVYLRFDSQEQADRYYRDYMTACEERMEKYLEKYNNTVLFDRMSTEQLTRGNILTYSSNNGYLEPLRGTITESMDSEDKKTLAQQKSTMVKNYGALCSKLSINYNGLTALELSRDVYENLILQTAVENIGVTEYTLNDMTALIGDNNDEGSAPVRVGSNASGNENCKLVIVTGDVEVSGNFEGLIIAGGEVKVTAGAGAVLGGDNAAVTKLLQHKPEALGGQTLMEAYFIDGAKYILKGNALNDSAYVNLDSVITYVNWTKK